MPSCDGVSALDRLRVVSPVLADELAQTILEYSNTPTADGEGVEMVEVTTGHATPGL